MLQLPHYLKVVIDGKKVYCEDFGITNIFEKEKLRGFYAYSPGDTYASGVVGTWCISESGSVKEGGIWKDYLYLYPCLGLPD